jgi:hypothetical protein
VRGEREHRSRDPAPEAGVIRFGFGIGGDQVSIDVLTVTRRQFRQKFVQLYGFGEQG